MQLNKYSFDSIDDIQLFILEKLFSKGEIVTTRELKTLELCNINFCLEFPRNRNTYNPKRKWNYPLAIGEFAWHLSGSNNLDFIAYYARQWKKYSNDGEFISQSCYGHKIFKKTNSVESQWDRLIKLLKYDRYSRRAVLNLYESDQNIDYFAKDIACVNTVQFLIRNNKLDIIVNMRSNDIIWGLPYDIYLFTMLQERLSLELGVELGKYYHNVGSIHIYERHFSLGKDMLNEKMFSRAEELVMDDIDSLPVFLNYEKIIRTSNISLEDIQSLLISQYWKSLLTQLWNYKNTKLKSQNTE